MVSPQRRWHQRRESIDESQGNNNDNPSEVWNTPRRGTSWLWRKVCPVQELEYEQSKYNQRHEEEVWCGWCQARLGEEARCRKILHTPSHAGAWDSVAGRKNARGRRVAERLVPMPWQKLEISSRRSLWYGRCQKKTSLGKSSEKVAKKRRRRWVFSNDDPTDQKALGDGEGDWNETRSQEGFPESMTREIGKN